MTWITAVSVDGVGKSLIGMHLRDDGRRGIRVYNIRKRYVIKENGEIGQERFLLFRWEK